MGGDLSQGTIKGDEVACPFHDWRWGGDGRKALVPYAKRTPRLARTPGRGRPMRGGLLFVWHDHEGNPPQPGGPSRDAEYSSGDWTDWKWNSMLIEGSNCREIIDNVTDMAHLFYIHRPPTYFKNVFEAHRLAVPAQRGPSRRRRTRDGYGESQLGFRGELRAVVHDQLAAQPTAASRPSRSSSTATAGDPELFMLQWGVIAENGVDDPPPKYWRPPGHRGFWQGFPAGRRDLEEQGPHREPAAGREDGLVYQMRRWYEQFYVDVADVTPRI